jgi:hypothetical protein
MLRATATSAMMRGHLRHADGWHDMHLLARLRHDPHDP